MKKQKRSLFLVLAILAFIVATWSLLLLRGSGPQTLDQRVQHIASQLKCPVCQGESVADSPSQLAQQMRLAIREQVQAGKSDQEIIQYFTHSYGEQIVWSPPWQGFTLLAWLAPIVLLLGGVILLFFIVRDWRSMTNSTSDELDRKLVEIDNADLEQYRALLEEELAADDPLFRKLGKRKHGTEASA